MSTKKLTLTVLEDKLGVCRLDNAEMIPGWPMKSNFFSITKTCDELSIVCSEDSIPNGIKCEKNWRGLKVEGPLDFGLIGILASISTTLANVGISIFAISTYDTDYILLKDKNLRNAINTLTEEGYEILE